MSRYDPTDQVFSSTQAALKFAFNHTSGQYDRPPMNRLAASTAGAGSGLGGLDGAAQAGFVLAEVATLSRLHQALLTAQFAVRGLPCSCGRPCCSGTLPNPRWQQAIADITREALRVLAGCTTHYHLRRGIVERCFGVQHDLAKLADRCGVHRDTATNHHGKVKLFLLGERGGRARQAKVGELDRALAAIDERLRVRGLVEG